ncbi:MAG: cytochrome c [Anderseniella sp.]|nr:cytochrome c [Anderseniella sp.]
MLPVKFIPVLSGLLILALTAGQVPARADDEAASIQRGKELAQLLCTRCHAIEGPGPGTEEKSPPFSTLVPNLTLEGIADQLLEGLPMGHDPMPKWEFSEQQALDLLLYIESVSATE